MKLEDFITHTELEQISQNIINEKDFEMEKKVREYEVIVRSLRAACDWESGVKEGDYLIGLNFSATDRGWGRPISGKKLKELGDVDKLRKYIDKKLSESNIKDYEALKEGQMSLFEMIM